MRHLVTNSAATLALILMAGCQAPRPLYYWGNYEGSLYEAYSSPQKTSPADQIAKLQEDLAKGASRGMKANPGLHAQLGYLYLQTGNFEAARKEFEIEKALFPESAVLMDRLLRKLTRPDES